MKHMMCALITGLGLFMTFAPQAKAHGLDRAIVVDEGRFARKFRPDFPRWLRAQRGFHEWYLHSRHRHARHPNWHRLYKQYRRDVRHHRHLRRHLRHRHWRGCR